jgi:hypothetical protein
MSRARKTVVAFAVFSPSGLLETARRTRDAAEDAASIIGGTEWATSGFTVEPVEVTRFTNTSASHPDMIE